MKKFCFALILFSVLFFGCNKKKTAPNIINGWYDDFDVALEVAKNENKSVLLLCYSYYDGMPGFVASAQALILNKSDFADALSDRYVCVAFNFSPEVLQEGFVGKDGGSEKINRQFKIADSYSISNALPAMVIVSEDGYYICDVPFNCDSYVVDGYISGVSSKDADVKFFNDYIDQIRNAEGIEKVTLIDALYERTPENQQLLLAPLCREILSLDEKNESGLLSKYILAVAHFDAYPYWKDDLQKVLEVYENAAMNEKLDAYGRESIFGLCANALIIRKSDDVDKIISYFEKAVAANGPDKKRYEIELDRFRKFVAENK